MAVVCADAFMQRSALNVTKVRCFILMSFEWRATFADLPYPLPFAEGDEDVEYGRRHGQLAVNISVMVYVTFRHI